MFPLLLLRLIQTSVFTAVSDEPEFESHLAVGKPSATDAHLPDGHRRENRRASVGLLSAASARVSTGNIRYVATNTCISNEEQIIHLTTKTNKPWHFGFVVAAAFKVSAFYTFFGIFLSLVSIVLLLFLLYIYVDFFLWWRTLHWFSSAFSFNVGCFLGLFSSDFVW